MKGCLRGNMGSRLLSGGCLLLVLILASCAFPGIASTSQQLPQVSQTPQVASLPPVRFPEDEGAHHDLTEWWYYTGHFTVTEASGKLHSYGFELVIFQVLRSDLPPVYASHFAISDISRGEFHYDQRQFMASEPLPAQASTAGINVHVGDWQIQGLNGHDHLVAGMTNYAIDFNLTSRKAPILHNGNGLITYGLAGFSYYYSRTRMAVAGTLQDHGQSLQVTGLAWMDHQWGNFLTLANSGWDWFSIQLNDTTEMMIYFIRDASGKTISTYASYIDQQGHDSLIAPSALQMTVLNKWTSPTTGITYPSGWRFAINDPQLHMTLILMPQLKGQELVTHESTGNTYWEGAVDIQGQHNGKPIDGAGYVELTGYEK
jgi:predicted secreted hydrolase